MQSPLADSIPKLHVQSPDTIVYTTDENISSPGMASRFSEDDSEVAEITVTAASPEIEKRETTNPMFAAGKRSPLKLAVVEEPETAKHKRRTLGEFRGIEDKLGQAPEGGGSAVTLPIRSWHASTEPLMHRQGLLPPPLVMQLVPSNRFVKRPFFQLFIPPTTYQQKEHCLFARKKSKLPVYRLSLDPHNMSKRNNPLYCGKIEATVQKPNDYIVSLPNRQRIMSISIGEPSKGPRAQRSLDVKFLADSVINEHEAGSAGRTFKATIQQHLQPSFCLRTVGSNRPVCVLYKETDVTASGGAAGGGHGDETDDAAQAETESAAAERPSSPSAESNKYFVDFDYPMSIFTAFCVACAVESERLDYS
eukprot:TRINITY_DN4159_c0_g1_i1.p1 TRINITY_DN4159_c0_g1~~TRINITY_DN4159_c0_g1_i1.p1  ORF type:complete len:364 (-),score=63.33 TRINITY_DN4159_c0_g1_i1:210-1301(-)